MKTLKVSADLLVKLMTKLSLSEQQERLVAGQVEMIKAITGGKLQPCHCPACLLPNLSIELGEEIAGQLSDGERLDDLCTPALIERIEDGLRLYIQERQADAEEEAMGKLPKDATVN